MDSRELIERVNAVKLDIEGVIREMTQIETVLPKRLKFFSAPSSPAGSVIELLKLAAKTAEEVTQIAREWERVVAGHGQVDKPPLGVVRRMDD